MSLLPNTVSAKDIQRNYRKAFDLAKETGEPVVVLTNNRPDVAIVDVKVLEKMIEKIEMMDAMEAIKIAEVEHKQGKIKKLSSLSDLLE
jgi:PHD/YefM family antitoxin component YafN of YafNO toxin-antitoxin module